MIREATLVFFVRDGKVLLAKKWDEAPIGAGLWNGYGGMFDKDQDIDCFDTAVREVNEESGLTVKRCDLTYCGNLICHNQDSKRATIVVHVFIAIQFEGQPVATKEMKCPTWFKIHLVTRLKMMEADCLFVPQVLRGEKIRPMSSILYSKDFKLLVSDILFE